MEFGRLPPAGKSCSPFVPNTFWHYIFTQPRGIEKPPAEGRVGEGLRDRSHLKGQIAQTFNPLCFSGLAASEILTF